jgi:hypothetical protein
VAVAINRSPQVSTRYLNTLTDAGKLSKTFEAISGGRPQAVYRVA